MITYKSQYLRKCLKASVALLHAVLDESPLHVIVGLFQEQKFIQRNFNEIPPRYLIEAIKLLKIGFTLTKAKRIVQLYPE